jgi:hypothetical protein
VVVRNGIVLFRNSAGESKLNTFDEEPPTRWARSSARVKAAISCCANAPGPPARG